MSSFRRCWLNAFLLASRSCWSRGIRTSITLSTFLAILYSKGTSDGHSIPYDGINSGAPSGAFEIVHDDAISLTENAVALASGPEVPCAYLAIATGSWQPSPSKLKSTGREEACVELQKLQTSIESAENIAIVGGGAVGVELASDIKSYYPNKSVTLVHSREQLLPRFGKRLHEHVVATLEKLSIRIILKQRPELSCNVGDEKGGSLTFAEGRVEKFDLVASDSHCRLASLIA